MNSNRHLDRFLDRFVEALGQEGAQAVIDLRVDESTQARIEGLRAKANDGTLTPKEDAEYKESVEALDLVSIIQSKARKFLAKNSASH